jgi:inorganic pyrophosphatase
MKLPKTFSKPDGHLNVIIETPSGSRNKFSYDKKTHLFKLSKVIPSGLQFPCNMGFIPKTKGEDGDPLDALILMNELTYPGCLVECRLLGVMKIHQTSEGKKIRNDRFIAVPAKAQEYDHLKEIDDINGNTIDALFDFFRVYNGKENKKIDLLGISGSKEAYHLIKKGIS